MNTKNSRTKESHRLELYQNNISKYRTSHKYVALPNLSIY